MRSDRQRLLDILEAIVNIERYAEQGRDAFFQEELIQAWIVHHIQIIGEAAAHISQILREQYPDILWTDIISMRNVLVHHYFGIDLEEIWDTVTIDIPNLKQIVKEILQEVPEDS